MKRFGVMYGPYDRQLTEYFFKLWFVFIPDEGDMTRYELSYAPNVAEPVVRHREIIKGKVPQYKANFNDYLPPDNIQSYPSEYFPRHKGDKIKDALISLLRDQDVADVVKVSRFGIIPVLPKNRIPKKYHHKIPYLQTANHGNHGEILCTLSPPPLT